MRLYVFRKFGLQIVARRQCGDVVISEWFVVRSLGKRTLRLSPAFPMSNTEFHRSDPGRISGNCVAGG